VGLFISLTFFDAAEAEKNFASQTRISKKLRKLAPQNTPKVPPVNIMVKFFLLPQIVQLSIKAN
jgi:hypothetical protein